MTASSRADLGRDEPFNDQWKFFKGDDARASEIAFDDSTWRTVDLPHDWSIEGPFDAKWASCTAFLPCGVGWYRKSFELPADAKGKSVFIRFDGIANHSTIWCNGKQVGERPYAYSSFTCDLTPVINFGGKNEIAVRVNHEQFADSRWYVGSGIYRNVFFSTVSKVHVDTNGTFVTTPKTSADLAAVDVQTIVVNDGAAAADATVTTSIKDSTGAIVSSNDETESVPAGASKAFSAKTNVTNPQLWSPDSPTLYTVQTVVKQEGNIVDQYTTPIGIRSFVFDPAKGFSINGKSMKIKGVCVHHDAGALGAAVPIEVWQRRLAILKDGGCNAIRCSHNPPAPEFLDLCDRMGFLVMDEAFDEWTRGKKKWVTGHNVSPASLDGYHSDFDKWADVDIRDMVVRDRNHPSIILWSIGNEIDYQNDAYPPNSPELPPIAERLIKDVKAVDTTRPVTAACASPNTNLYKKLLDVEGYNYMEKLYADDHTANPARVMYGSENSQTLQAWESVEKDDYIAGQFLWTGIDYLGEAGVWPSHGSAAGLLNLAGFPKPMYYFRQSLWSDKPMVYLSTRGLQARRRGPSGPPDRGIACFTNCDDVELFQDGISLGSKHHNEGEVLNWPVNFTGTLKAVGTKGANSTSVELKKAGDPAKIVLKSDLDEFKQPGPRIAQIEVDIADEDGTLVQDAANSITAKVTGPAKILGIENGDLRTTESCQAPTHSVYQGRMLIYLECLKGDGEVTLSVSTPNLDGAAVTLPVH
jgi:beta-galactosidase